MNSFVDNYNRLLSDYPAFEATIDWVTTSGLSIVLILVGVSVVRRFSMILISKVVRETIKADHFATKRDEEQREDTLVSIVNTSLRVGLWIVAGMLIMDQLGLNIGPLIAGAGVLGLAIGFGAQSLVADFVAGVLIIMENQYRVGDVVEISGVSGTVEAITMRATVIRDLDGNQHHIPNGSISISTNMSMEYANVNMNIGVGYDSDIEKVEKVVNKVGTDLAKANDWSKLITEPMQFVRVDNFGDSAVEVKIVGKVKPGKQWKVAGEFRKRLKLAFDKNKIEIPFPQRVIHNK